MIDGRTVEGILRLASPATRGRTDGRARSCQAPAASVARLFLGLDERMLMLP
jgi:hypothetical protein